MPYQRRRTIQKLTTHRNRIRTFSTTQCTLTGLIFHPDESMPVVQVALPVPLARNFDYLLPPHLNHAVVGGRVSVPFGKRKAIGVVVGIVEHSDFPLDQLKSVHEVLDSESLYPASLWRILLWAADYYHYPLGEVLFHAMPVLLRQGKAAEEAPLWQWLITDEGKATAPESLKRAPKQQQALAALRNRGLYRHEVSQHDITEATLQALRAKGL
ncbi:MAG TPA: primosomal protein N', partial [Erwinia persicina]|nr:primosomal protein N' [Erwinia persicina]HBT29670.1 primosomal protein N' [Erwinia persicina]HBT53779.1 primosomal protein N' [Erwinia persicina]